MLRHIDPLENSPHRVKCHKIIMFKPNNLTVTTTSISLSSITISSNWGWHLANEILSSLHLLSFNWSLFLLDNNSTSSSTAFWMLVIFPFSTGSAIVVSSTYSAGWCFSLWYLQSSEQRAMALASLPGGHQLGHLSIPIYSHSQSFPSFTLCLRHFRKSTIQQTIS